MQDRLQVLIVDGDAADRRRIRRAVRSRHPQAEIRAATRRSEATGALRSHRFDCVLLEQRLPDGSGLEWLVDVREEGDTTPIIVLADRGDEKLAVEAIRAGASDYLPKPDLTPQLLAHCLRAAIRYQQSQEQVRRAHEALLLRDRAIAAASNGILICDPHQDDAPVIYCNPAFTAMTGYPPEEVLGRNCRFLQGEGTDDLYVQQVRDCLREGREGQVILRNYRKDGTPFWNELTISPVRDEGGHLTHFIGVQTDITERREAEEALRRIVARQQSLLRDVFASVTEGKLRLCASADDLPPPHTRFADPVPLSRTGGIRELRQHVVRACAAASIPAARCDDLETAVGEAAMNAVVHAATGTGHVFTHERGTVQVRVEDEGRGIALSDLPNATLRRGYSTAGTMGHGFKMILTTVDRVHLLTGGAGTTVVMEQDRAAPLSAW